MTRSPTIRLILCRPQGGLNDIFCQIVKTCEYGQKFGRKVFIDTAYVYSHSFWDVFARYFVAKFDAIVLDPSSFLSSFKYLSVYPPELSDRLNDVRGFGHEDKNCWSEPGGKGFKLTYDFTKDYDEQLLVHYA